MTEAKPIEGVAGFSYPTLSTTCQTWYQIHGPLTQATQPIIVLHGGPGSSHIYMTDLIRLRTKHNQTVIFYDQIGCGKSTHYRQHRRDASFWTVELFIAELNNLVAHLQISNFTLLGHSWGGMLGTEYAIAQNPHDPSRGLQRLIISNSPISMELFSASCAECRAGLPNGINDTINRHEQNEDYANPDYLNAVNEFYKLYMCRRPNTNGVDPFPDNFMAMMKSVEDDDTVYFTMNGPSEFTTIGNLKEWSVKGRINAIKVPTLLVNGEFDEVRAFCVKPLAEGIAGAEWKVLEGTSHCGFIEEPDKYCDMVMEWLGKQRV